MANLIRVKQLDQPDLSGFFNNVFVNTGIIKEVFVDKFSDENISGIKTFIDGVNLNNIDNLSLSGVDVSIGDANVSITNSDVGTNGANLTVQGSGTFFKGIKIADGQVGTANPAISIYDGPNDDYNKISWSDSLLGFNNFPSISNQSLYYDFSNDPNGTAQSIAVDSKVVHNTTNETISGIKTFASRPTVNGTGVALNGETTNLPNVVVFTTGNQTISGIKTFGNSGIFSLSGTAPLILPNNPLSIVGSGNTYIQVNIQNRATGVTATADLVITANNGTDSSNYIDLGINNSGYNDPNFSNGSAYDGYLFVNVGSLDIGTQTTGTSIEFHVGGTTAIRTVARITADGLNIVSGTLTSPNIVYNIGDQTISGVKTFNLQPILSGNALITGNLSLYATTANLFITGSGLQTQINNLGNTYATTTNLANTGSTLVGSINLLSGNLTSNYATITNLTSTGSNLNIKINSLSGYSVLITGNQLISGVKTFFDSGIFSNGGAPAVALLNNPLSIVGSGNNYVQLNIQNRATGTTATADLVITANNGTDNSNFINLGINNVGYSDPAFSNTTGLDGYLIMDGGDLDIGTRTPGKIIEFHAGGTTEANVIARISQTGLNIVSGNLTVGGTGVLLSGQSNFTLNFISNQATTNNTGAHFVSSNYFGAFAAGYGNNAVDRAFPVLENCIARKIVFSTQLAATWDIPATTGYFINTTTNITGSVPITTSPATSNTLYNYIGNINVPINNGDNVVCLLKTTGVIPTFRSAAQVYCYK
jgi:hypothetical protein